MNLSIDFTWERSKIFLTEKRERGGVFLLQKQLPEVFCKKNVLRNFAKFPGKHLCQNLFLNKVTGLRAATFLKKRLWHRCFPRNVAKFLRTHFYRTTLGDCLCIYKTAMQISESKEFLFVRLIDDCL